MDMLELLESAVMDGIIEIACPTCGDISITEPDGDGYCDSCNKPINNPLREAGMI